VDARVGAATTQDLKAAIAAGRFREDLFYRLCVVNIQVPPQRERGDDLRGLPPFIGDDGAMFFAMNRNKRSIALDLKTPSGQELALRLIAGADVLVESFGTGVTERLGLGHEALRARFPRLVYCSISGFGRTGPLGSRPGFEVMMQAYTGLMLTTGDKDSGPLRIGFSPLDQTTGIHAAAGVMAALRTRDRTGKGSYLEVSLFETALSFMGWHAQAYWMTGALPERSGSGHGSLCPYQAFRASDGYILIAAGSEALWRKLCDAIGLAEYKEDPRFSTNRERVARRDETVALVQGRIATRSVADWMAVLTDARIPCSPINGIDRILTDPQTDARGMVMQYHHPVGHAMKAVACPLTLDGVAREVRRAPPLHGEHTDEILREIGCDQAPIAALRTQGVAGVAPAPDARNPAVISKG
jgi:formyl-CoA transferase